MPVFLPPPPLSPLRVSLYSRVSFFPCATSSWAFRTRVRVFLRRRLQRLARLTTFPSFLEVDRKGGLAYSGRETWGSTARCWTERQTVDSPGRFAGVESSVLGRRGATLREGRDVEAKCHHLRLCRCQMRVCFPAARSSLRATLAVDLICTGRPYFFCQPHVACRRPRPAGRSTLLLAFFFFPWGGTSLPPCPEFVRSLDRGLGTA